MDSTDIDQMQALMEVYKIWGFLWFFLRKYW